MTDEEKKKEEDRQKEKMKRYAAQYGNSGDVTVPIEMPDVDGPSCDTSDSSSDSGGCGGGDGGGGGGD